ncbi:antitoxin [Phytomonospora sp. NPDC050363]|uniref:antitoxin n=1 Tax=Phytomonospora sp. NPDC050363 TaxID=3155642 RepID=UPI0033D99AB8
MGFGDKIKEGFDKVKETVSRHDDKVDQGIEKASDFVNEKTKNKHAGHVDKAKDKLQGMTGSGDTQP